MQVARIHEHGAVVAFRGQSWIGEEHSGGLAFLVGDLNLSDVEVGVDALCGLDLLGYRLCWAA